MLVYQRVSPIFGQPYQLAYIQHLDIKQLDPLGNMVSGGPGKELYTQIFIFALPLNKIKRVQLILYSNKCKEDSTILIGFHMIAGSYPLLSIWANDSDLER